MKRSSIRITYDRPVFYKGARVEVMYDGEWKPGLIARVLPKAYDVYEHIKVALDEGWNVWAVNDGVGVREAPDGEWHCLHLRQLRGHGAMATWNMGH